MTSDRAQAEAVQRPAGEVPNEWKAAVDALETGWPLTRTRHYIEQQPGAPAFDGAAAWNAAETQRSSHTAGSDGKESGVGVPSLLSVGEKS